MAGAGSVSANMSAGSVKHACRKLLCEHALLCIRTMSVMAKVTMQWASQQGEGNGGHDEGVRPILQ